jgi:general secretion pathway protein A
VGGGGGFVLLTGEIGAGKTTVCRCFLEQIPRRCNVAYIFNPKLTVEELLRSVCDEFHIPYPSHSPGADGSMGTVKDYLDPLNEFLLKTHAVGQNNVLIIDEAQSLSADVLEQLRLLTNLETSERKLLQIILIGQPELRSMLARPELEQLAQRVIARFHLDALSAEETGQYIRHRLAVAGLVGAQTFPEALMPRIHQWTRGVPRRINLLCDRALLGAYAESQQVVTREILDKAATEVFGSMPSSAPAPSARTPRMPRWGWPLVAGSVLFGTTALTLAVVDRVRTPDALRPASSEVRGPSVPPVVAPLPTDRAALPLASASASRAPAAAARLTLMPSGLWGQLTPQADADATSLFDASPRDEASAWVTMAALWGMAVPTGPSEDPCEAGARQGLQCYRGNGGLALIRQLARPAMLTLHDETGRAAHVVLTGLTPRSAVLRVGGRSKSIPLSELTELWHGDFTTLWRAPPGYMGKVSSGQTGPAVDRLAAQLASWRGEPSPRPPVKVDDRLAARVSAFQVAQGLKPDGVAGAVTFMQLNRATGVDEPRLQTDWAAR